MTRIFFAPVADISTKSKFYETAVNGIKTTNGHQKLWGVISPDVTWSRVNKGDILYIYNKSNLVFRATIKSKFQDTELAKSLWDCKKKIDGTILYYDKIMELESVYSCNISFDIFKELAGYKEKASIRKFMELSKLGYSNLTQKFGNIEELEKITAPNSK